MQSRQVKTENSLSLIRSWLVLLIPVIFLSSLGLIILISAGSSRGDTLVFFKKQCIWLCVAFVFGLVSCFISLNFLKKIAWILAGFSLSLLVLVLIPGIGKTVNGARRWIEVGPITIQPSDIAKIALVICLATYLQNNQRKIKTFVQGLVFPLMIIGAFAGLILKEPDFGTATLCIVVGFSLLYLAGVRLIFIAPFAALAALGVSILVYFDPVRLARFLSFLDVEGNKSSGTYQLYQAILAFGAGGVSGAGLGQGRQQLSFLPEAHTDFIFAVVGEELGLILTLCVVAAFFIIFLVAILKIRNAPNMFEFCIAIGSMLMITFQAVFNMGVVTGLFPTKGISLPYLSYGGSNLVAMFVFTGLLINCIRSWEKPIQIKASRV